MGRIIGAQRRQDLIRRLSEQPLMRIDTLADESKVSTATVRRDLMELESKGYLKRMHGGVLFLGRPGMEQIQTLQEREVQFLAEKKAIGQKAAALVQDGETVILDGGTTTCQAAKYLRDKKIQVVTNSLLVANLFADSLNVELFLLGGVLYPKRGVFLGPFTEEMAGKIRAQKAFLGARGITREGIANTDSLTAKLQRIIIAGCEQTIVVADHTKFGRNATYPVEDLSQIDMIVTDRMPADNELKKALKKSGVKMLLAGKDRMSSSEKD